MGSVMTMGVKLFGALLARDIALHLHLGERGGLGVRGADKGDSHDAATPASGPERLNAHVMMSRPATLATLVYADGTIVLLSSVRERK